MQIHSQISVDGQARRIWTNCQENRNKHSREFSARTSVDAALLDPVTFVAIRRVSLNLYE